MKIWLALADRTAVLFLGVAVGTAIGFAFADARRVAPVAAPAIVAPPPPAADVAPAPRIAANDMIAASPRPSAAAPAPASPAVPLPAAVGPAVDSLPILPRLIQTLHAGRPVRIGVFGDSFGDGVWSGLREQLRARQGYEVAKFSQQATGFTRYKRLDVEAHTAAQIAAAPVDVAVISFGANDTQGVIANGHLATYMTPAWQDLIGQRVGRLVALLRAQGAVVYWVGLPRMRKLDFDADIGAMNAFYQRRMAALGVPFIDPRPVSSGPAGFAPYLPDPATGKPVLMRAEDGVHMSMNGYVWITRDLARRIRAHVDAARRVAQGPSGGASAPAVAAPPPAPEPTVPTPTPQVPA